MKKVKQFWDWLSGKKTAIGSAMFSVAEIAESSGIIPIEYAKALELVKWFGVFLSTGVGIPHKLFKAKSNG